MSIHNNLRIILYDPSGRGGVTHYTYQLAESLACAGSDVTVITTEDYELKHLKRSFEIYIPFTKSWVKSFLNMTFSPLRKKSISQIKNSHIQSTHNALKQQKNIANSFLKIGRLWLIWIKITFFLFWKNPHAIHFQWLIDKKNTFYFMKFLKILRFNIVYTAHDILPHGDNSQNSQTVFGKIYRISDKIIVHAESNKREIVKIFKIDPSKVHVIPHGSFDIFYTDKSITKEIARKKIKIPDEKRVILFFGLIKKYKGLEYLVSAFQKIKEELDNVLLLIVGNIYNGDSEDFKFYSDLIDLISHDDDIICVNEYVPLEKIHAYFLASDVVVLPYIKTYTSGVLLAAYAAGRPVIATDTGALSEVVDIGKSGFIVPPKDVNALAQIIMKTLSNPDHMEEMGNYAKHLSETLYSWKSVASQTINVYQSLNKAKSH
jgi:glycosyltransferase involved in cell wall biosynthesis